MEKQCPICNLYFEADQPWKKICLDCWKRNKRQEQEAERSARKRPSQPPVVAIPDEMLKTLINLCHPDRHGGKESATRATQYLLSLRGK